MKPSATGHPSNPNPPNSRDTTKITPIDPAHQNYVAQHQTTPMGMDESVSVDKNTAPTEKDEDFDLTSRQRYVPLALAGALGGFCNTGVHFVVGTERKVDLLPGHEQPLWIEFPVYLFFSILLGAVLGPAVAMFSIGMPNKQNWNRLLVVTVVFGTFLTITIDTAEKSISINERNQILEEKVKEKEEEVEQTRKEVIEREAEVKQKEKEIEQVNDAANQVLEEKLPVVSIDARANPTNTELRVSTLKDTGCSSNDADVIEDNVSKLGQLRKSIENAREEETKDKLIQQIDDSLTELKGCLEKVQKDSSTTTSNES